MADPVCEEFTVGLSMFSDVRTAWHPRVRKASGSEAMWVDVPVYLAMRHAPQNWGHHAVESHGGNVLSMSPSQPLGVVRMCSRGTRSSSRHNLWCLKLVYSFSCWQLF
eukprot:s3436_g14.t1